MPPKSSYCLKIVPVIFYFFSISKLFKNYEKGFLFHLNIPCFVIKIFKFLCFVLLRRTYFPAYIKNTMEKKFCDISDRQRVYLDIFFVEYLRREHYFDNGTRTTKRNTLLLEIS